VTGVAKLWVSISRLEALPDGESRVFQVGSRWIAICRRGLEIYAVDDVCPHDTGPLGDGPLDGYEIVCPRHGARFDVRTGSVKCPPAPCGIETWPTRLRDGQVEIELEIRHDER
jgi:3-phenylpropionate/trans-cinnamate dioxygenase ferredoxin subunit